MDAAPIASDASAPSTSATLGVPAAQVHAQLLLPEDHFGLHTLSCGQTKLQILPNGCVYAIEHDGIQINQVRASPLAGGLHRIYVRAHGEAIESASMVGPDARNQHGPSADGYLWSSTFKDLACSCICRLATGGKSWQFDVEIANKGASAVTVDCIMLQDVALAVRSQARNNELYNSQYLDHAAFTHSQIGPVVCTRQNLAQSRGANPWLLQGCHPSARGFCTDGSDFFGTGHRAPMKPAALVRAVIGSTVRQHETGYIALQTQAAVIAPGGSTRFTFFAIYEPDHPAASSEADLARVRAMLDAPAAPFSLAGFLERPTVASVFTSAPVFRSLDLPSAALDRYFPTQRRHVETAGGALHSFFHGDDARHVVLRAKEHAIARQHGHIVRSGKGYLPTAAVLSCACYAAGVFASQITAGNTSLAKFSSAVRDPMNLIRSSGLRLFVRQAQGHWELLASPSAFEMWADGCRWIYFAEHNHIVVTLQTSLTQPVMLYHIEADEPVEVLASMEVACAPCEYDHPAKLLINANAAKLTIHPSSESIIGATEPQLRLHLSTPHAGTVASLGGDELLSADGQSRGLPYAVVQSKLAKEFTLQIEAQFAADESGNVSKAFDAPRPPLLDAIDAVRIELPDRGLEHTLQDTLRWFARDAIVHLSIPRGLEQANGGAWGVRDVCQGPMEFLLAYHQHRLAADILLKLFSQQYARRHDWPQWFMFPPYQSIQSKHCHGDVLIWPLKALCDYLEESNDGELLTRRVAYTDDETFAPTDRTETILQHADRVIDKMRRDFLPGLSLPRFGDGDWDDSLQPADSTLRDRMVSAWTAELMFQTLHRYATALAQFGHAQRAAQVAQLAQQIHDDFQTFLLPDGVVAGFSIFEGNGTSAQFMLHPRDTRTGLKYRLLPMTRGIISGIFSPEQADAHLRLIQKHLLFPDGARLMDRPTPYRGGTETIFRRAESAAFFGREIGLQYVHAHLRYAEAMAKLGRADDLLQALLVVNPIAVTEVVPKARARQRNCFFSSSDAAFTNRRQAFRDYDQLRAGEIEVDGGWRIYSSGPGIYANLVIRHLFGLRRYFDWIEFDPVLPAALDGASISVRHNDAHVCYQYSVKHNSAGPKNVRINGITVRPTQHAANPYRAGGFRFPLNEFEAMLTLERNTVEIDL